LKITLIKKDFVLGSNIEEKEKEVVGPASQRELQWKEKIQERCKKGLKMGNKIGYSLLLGK
jgi:hypothetical protein